MKIQKSLTISAIKAQTWGLLTPLPFICLLLILFYILGDLNITAIKSSFPDFFNGFLIMFGGIIIHELIHGITWSLFCKQGFKSIKFGVIWKALTPYCHCKEALTKWQYSIGTLMPGIILGIIPALIGIVTNSCGYLLFGLFFTLAAGGDLLIIWLLRPYQQSDLVEDHPTKIGCIVTITS